MLDFVDIQEDWLWIKFTLPKGEVTRNRFQIKSKTKSERWYDGSRILTKEYVANYPVDTSFCTLDNSLPLPTSFLIKGITFLIDLGANEEDSRNLVNNYTYHLFLLQKWYHRGPLRLFPPSGDSKVWADMWNPPLTVLRGMGLSIELQGNPFIPKEDINCKIAMMGEYTRSIQ